MIFTLEALDAKNGDCLILHYGSAEKPSFILIDGGPAGVYKERLRPRLEELKRAYPSDDDQLSLDMAMVSHVDDDHIAGIIQLFEDLKECKDLQRPVPFAIRTLWHNGFEDLAAKANTEDGAKSMGASAAELKSLGFPLVTGASIGQGKKLRELANGLGVQANLHFSELVEAPAKGAETSEWGDLKITVIGPSASRLKNLEAEWKKGAKKPAKAPKAGTAAYDDGTIPNLSSIVVMAELEKKRMLLAGDGRGDDILAGLGAAGILTDGKVHVDLLKIPHHGSVRNVDDDFFRNVTADHYVISANGKDGNPENATLNMISDARNDDAFTVHFTNRDGKPGFRKRIDAFFAAEKKKNRKYSVVFRADGRPSVKVDLFDKVMY